METKNVKKVLWKISDLQHSFLVQGKVTDILRNLSVDLWQRPVQTLAKETNSKQWKPRKQQAFRLIRLINCSKNTSLDAGYTETWPSQTANDKIPVSLLMRKPVKLCTYMLHLLCTRPKLTKTTNTIALNVFVIKLQVGY